MAAYKLLKSRLLGGDFRRWMSRAAELARLPLPERRFFLGALMLARPVSFAVEELGFPRVLRWLERTQRNAPSSGGVGARQGEELVRLAFRIAAPDKACLERALTQYLVHCRVGPAPRLVLGVEKRVDARSRGWDLGAHAWVEESTGPGRAGEFEPILTLSPGSGVDRPGGTT